MSCRLLEPSIPFFAAQIIMAVANHYGIEIKDLLGRSRRQSKVVPRYVAMCLCRKHTDLSYPALGRVFGRHHTCVMHAMNVTRMPAELEKAILGGLR